ncbi:RHE_PE00001 family protein [Methylocystis sp. ATCC 49242]|uniref:RHE_PE00001 family protein n=1 Tax=Methylocystis sp. ATCC 49242 TaxID=622637 RepID=UPI0001F888EC|nr:RHE_PE00001 family protein [Methylocystis sp. ATCC 49242]
MIARHRFPADSEIERLLPPARLQGPFEAASDVLARLDERLRSSPVAEAFIVRADFHDACAALWRQGDFVQIEDLVLHDAGMDARAPTHELVRANAALLTRRRIAGQPPGWALTAAGLAALRGARTVDDGAVKTNDGNEYDDDDEGGDFHDSDDDAAPLAGEFAEIDALLARSSAAASDVRAIPLKRDDSGLVYDEDWDEEGRLDEWRAALKEIETLPPLLAAALAYEGWETLEPLRRQSWLGPLLAAALLRARGKTRHHLASLHAGFRHVKYRRSRHHDLATRLVGFAQAVETMAATGLKEIDRLTLARQLLLRRCAGRRGNSKLPRLVDLCLRLPVVSVPLAAKELGVSQQAATTMIDELSPNLRELTGRRRYRAWAVM